MKENKFKKATIVIAALLVLAIVGMLSWPQYELYKANMDGKVNLAEAQAQQEADWIYATTMINIEEMRATTLAENYKTIRALQEDVNESIDLDELIIKSDGGIYIMGE